MILTRPSSLTIHGNPLTLMGQPLSLGQKAPDFEVLDNDLNPVTLKSMAGKTCVLVTVPSLDTPVCDLESRRFEREALALGPDVLISVVSMDLPFAQKRWCGGAGTTRIRTLSDHRTGALGMAYGCLIKELRLLARAIFVVDRSGLLRYQGWVPELTQEPDYAEVLAALKEMGA